MVVLMEQMMVALMAFSKVVSRDLTMETQLADALVSLMDSMDSSLEQRSVDLKDESREIGMVALMDVIPVELLVFDWEYGSAEYSVDGSEEKSVEH